MQTRKLFLLLYAAATATDLLAILQNHDDIRFISKPVLMPLLIIYAFTRIVKKKKLFTLLIISLTFSWMGDVLLLMDNGTSNYFMFGLIAFLLAHIGYIIMNHNSRYANTASALLPTQQMRYLFILILAGSAIVYVLYPHLGDLKLPVIIYAGVLTYMVISALYRYGRTQGRSFALVFCGALFFMLSDAMLAVNKFVESFSYAGFWVMFTYASAQFLIVEGLAYHTDEK